MTLKSRSNIIDLDHVELFLKIFFTLSCLMASKLHYLSGSTFIFGKNNLTNVTNLALRLTLAAELSDIESFVVEYIFFQRGCTSVFIGSCYVFKESIILVNTI